VSLASEILNNWAPILRSVLLQPGERGRFEVTLDGELLFSKARLGRHAEKGEIVHLIEDEIGASLNWRKTT
jgi:selenoprotein W-related protein